MHFRCINSAKNKGSAEASTEIRLFYGILVDLLKSDSSATVLKNAAHAYFGAIKVRATLIIASFEQNIQINFSVININKE